jgi:hypothetical protein
MAAGLFFFNNELKKLQRAYSFLERAQNVVAGLFFFNNEPKKL